MNHVCLSARIVTRDEVAQLEKYEIPCCGEIPVHLLLSAVVESFRSAVTPPYAKALAESLAGARFEEISLYERLLFQQAFISARFPNQSSNGIIDHALDELAEIENAPTDIEEWIDLALLAFSGALKNGATPAEIITAFVMKQEKNNMRRWPEKADPEKAVNHIAEGQK